MNTICESFWRRAGTYERFAPVHTAMAGWLAEWLPGDRCGAALEIGAGTGLFTSRAQPWEGRYVASDASADMVAAGRARVPELEWRELAAERVGRGSWDWILSCSMLQWATDPVALLRAWRGSLAPGGRVLAGFYVADTLPELGELFIGGCGPLEWRDVAAWRAAFASAEFRILRDAAETRPFFYPSARELLRSLHATGAAPHRLATPGKLLGWLRARGETPFRATWTFYRIEAA